MLSRRLKQRKRGFVVWASDPFKENGSQTRPWVIVSNSKVKDGDFLTMPLTTNKRENSVPIKDRDLIFDELPADRSYVNTWVMRALKESYVRSTGGRIQDRFVDSVTDDFLDYTIDAPSTLQTHPRGAIVETPPGATVTVTGASETASRWLVLNNDRHPFKRKLMAVQLTNEKVSRHSVPAPDTLRASDGSLSSIPDSYISPTRPSPLWDSDISRVLGTIDPVVVDEVHALLGSLLK